MVTQAESLRADGRKFPKVKRCYGTPLQVCSETGCMVAHPQHETHKSMPGDCKSTFNLGLLSHD